MRRDTGGEPLDPRDGAEDGPLRRHYGRLESSAHPHPEFADELERRLLALPKAGDGRRWVPPAIAATLLVGALVGGALAGGIFRARELANEPSATPAATLPASASPPATESPAAEATPIPTASPSATASPTPSPDATASASQRDLATRSPSPTPAPALTWRALTDEIDVSRGVADSVLAEDGLVYTFLWGAETFNPMLVHDPSDDSVEFRQVPSDEQLQVDAQGVVGPDGLVYLFGWGASNNTSVDTFDSVTETFGVKPELSITAWDAAVGENGTIYLLESVNTSGDATGGYVAVHAYDPDTGAVTQVAESDALGTGSILTATPGRELVVVGTHGVASVDPATGTWSDIASAPEIGFSRVAGVDDEGRVIAATDGMSVRYFDGVEWHDVAAPGYVRSLTWVDSRWIAITQLPHPGHPESARYWEVTPSQ